MQNLISSISNGQSYEIHKRFSDFEKLVKEIRAEDSKLFLPALPNKIFSANLSLYDENFIFQRKRKLEIFLNKLLTNSNIIKSKSIQLFLQQVKTTF